MAYLPTGADEETPRRDELLVIAQEWLVLEREQLRIAKRGALFEGIKLAFTVAIPVAAFLGLQKYFETKGKETR
jgi:hypothetical protein